MILVMSDISITYAQRRPAEGPEGGRSPWILPGGRRGALLYPVGHFPADRDARVRDGHGAVGAPPPWRQPDRRGADAARARRRGTGALGGNRSGSRGDRWPARRTPEDGVLPDRRRHADAAGDRHLPRLLPRCRADARRGRARGDRPATARWRAGPRAAVRVRRREPARRGHEARGAARGPALPRASS